MNKKERAENTKLYNKLLHKNPKPKKPKVDKVDIITALKTWASTCFENLG